VKKQSTYRSGFCITEDVANYDAHAKCPGTFTTPFGTHTCNCPRHADDPEKEPEA
jgi:hypothetical protein